MVCTTWQYPALLLYLTQFIKRANVFNVLPCLPYKWTMEVSIFDCMQLHKVLCIQVSNDSSDFNYNSIVICVTHVPIVVCSLHLQWGHHYPGHFLCLQPSKVKAVKANAMRVFYCTSKVVSIYFRMDLFQRYFFFSRLVQKLETFNYCIFSTQSENFGF